MYTTAIAVDHDNQTYSITCRDLKKSKSKEWKRIDKSTVTWNEHGTATAYKIVFEGNKIAAEKNKHRFEDAFDLAGFTKIQIKK